MWWGPLHERLKAHGPWVGSLSYAGETRAASWDPSVRFPGRVERIVHVRIPPCPAEARSPLVGIPPCVLESALLASGDASVQVMQCTAQWQGLLRARLGHLALEQELSRQVISGHAHLGSGLLRVPLSARPANGDLSLRRMRADGSSRWEPLHAQWRPRGLRVGTPSWELREHGLDWGTLRVQGRFRESCMVQDAGYSAG